jgi:uncharacterized delta-60 repeat protein
MLKAKSQIYVNNLITCVTFAAACLIAFLLSGSIVAQSPPPGSLDPTFGNGGIVSRFIQQSSIAKAVAIQPDGKIVETGWYAGRFGLIRYNANGLPDPSFGSNGVVTTSIPWGHIEDMAIQSDGRIVVAGWSSNGQKLVFAIARYLINGSLDTSLGGTGIVTTAIPRSGNNVYDSLAYGLAVQLDGKIVVIGDSCYWVDDGGDGYCADYSFVTVRYNTEGTLDSTFGNGGIVSQSGIAFNRSVAIQPDKKIVVAGAEQGVVRYNADGSIDASFGNGGTSNVNNTTDMVIQADGKIVLSTRAYASGAQVFGVTRINEDGTLDSTFGSGGLAITPGGGIYGSISNSLAIQSDGRIVVAGTGFDPNVDWRYLVRRYNPNGSLDHSYGSNGLVRIQVGGLHNEAFAIAVDMVGRAVVAGCAFSDSGWGLIRLTGGGIAARRSQFDFDADGRSDISVFRATDSVWYLNRSNQGFAAIQFGLSTDKIVPADYDGDGKTDIAVFRDGVWWLVNSSVSTVTALQFGVSGDIPVPADYTGDGRDELAVYRNGEWWSMDLTSGRATLTHFGLGTDKPVVADYDGDGKADQAVYRNGEWHINRSRDGYTVGGFGLPTDRPVPADYDGDGKTDMAVYRAGVWYLNRSRDGFAAIQFGVSTDIPAPADYEGDGRADQAIYRDGVWWLLQSSGGITTQPFGLASDTPIPSA